MFSRKEYEIASQVVKIIGMVIRNEGESEELKVTLAENIRFDVFDAFRAIDRQQKGYFTATDLFDFMLKNGYSAVFRMCQFFVFMLSDGNDQINYRQFMDFLIPRYDKQASMACVARKLYSQIKSKPLTFYFQEFLTKLIWQELEYFRTVEIEKLKLAQLSEWKFMRVFSLISPHDYIDKNLLDAFLIRTGSERLTPHQYLQFMVRFNRNNDKLIQREEFSDAIFPNGYLLQKQEEDQPNTFDKYIKNYENQLDHFLGRNLNADDDNPQFKPEEHKFSHEHREQLNNEFVVDQTNRQYLAMDPYLAVSAIVPEEVLKRQDKEVKHSQFATSIPVAHTFQPNTFVPYNEIDPNSALRYYNLPASGVYNKSIIQEEPHSQVYQSPSNSNFYRMQRQDYNNQNKNDGQKDLLGPYIKNNGFMAQNNDNQNERLIPSQKPMMKASFQPQLIQNKGQQLDMSQSITQSQLLAYQQQPSNKAMLLQSFK